MLTGKKIPGAAMAALSAAALVALAASPAAAANSGCSIFSSACTTGAVNANSSGHYVWIQATNCDGGSASWSAWDVTPGANNGNVIGSGGVPAGYSVKKKIPGLWGTYKARVSGSNGDYINLTNSDPGWTEGTTSC